MAQVPILNGVYADTNADFRSSYPRNMVPVPKDTGISKGYLKPGEGLKTLGTGPGIDRGGINWNGVVYRVMGSKLVTVASGGAVNIIGDVGAGPPVTFDYSFDRLAVCSNGNFYYLFNGVLSQVTSPNLGVVSQFIWIDGYFLMHDGTNLVVTTLNDPTNINPLAYGSSEADPDKIQCIVKIRNEAAAVNRYTIEFFQDIGGNLFPFQRIDGAEVMRGCIGIKCAVAFKDDSIAFLGSARKEPPAVWTALNGLSEKISTREIDKILKNYTENQLSQAILEVRVEDSHYLLYVQLPNRTLVYDQNATELAKEPVWYFLDSGFGDNNFAMYRARNLVWAYNQWNFGDPTTNNVGTFSNSTSDHYGQKVTWEFQTLLVYNSTNGAIVWELELVGLTGSIKQGVNPTIWTSYTTDGVTWSNEKPRSAGRIGQRNARLVWLQCGNMRLFRGQKFRGDSDAHIAVASLEARIEALNN